MMNMKKAFYFIAAIVMMCMMTACESKSVSQGRDLYRKYLYKTAIVPDELKIYDESFVESEDGYSVEWTVDVGGITRGGQHFRRTMHFETHGGAMLKTDDGDLIDASRLQ